jgi:hypothetical protein
MLNKINIFEKKWRMTEGTKDEKQRSSKMLTFWRKKEEQKMKPKKIQRC